MIFYFLLFFIGNNLRAMEQIIESKEEFAIVLQNRCKESITVTLKDKKERNLIDKKYLSSMQKVKLTDKVQLEMHSKEVCGWHKAENETIYFPLFLLMGKLKDSMARLYTIQQTDKDKIFIYTDKEDIEKA